MLLLPPGVEGGGMVRFVISCDGVAVVVDDDDEDDDEDVGVL